MSERRSQDGALLNATSFAAESVCCWNLSTQIGASAATTAVSARWLANFSAVLPIVHPSDENPTTANAPAPTTAPHNRWFHPGMDLHYVTLALGEIVLVQIKRGSIARGEPATVGSETTQTTLTQQRRPLHPIPLVSPRDGSSLRHLGLGGFVLVQIKRGNIARGEPATVGSETTQTTLLASIVGDRRRRLLTGREGAAHPNDPIGAPPGVDGLRLGHAMSSGAPGCPSFPTREFVYLDGGGKRAARDRCSAPS